MRLVAEVEAEVDMFDIWGDARTVQGLSSETIRLLRLSLRGKRRLPILTVTGVSNQAHFIMVTDAGLECVLPGRRNHTSKRAEES